jgi:hypothetical protein
MMLWFTNQGPEVRSGDLPQPIFLESGQEFTFTIERGVGTDTCVSVNYDDFVNDVEVGDMLLVDGMVMFSSLSNIICFVSFVLSIVAWLPNHLWNVNNKKKSLSKMVQIVNCILELVKFCETFLILLILYFSRLTNHVCSLGIVA